MTCNHVWYEKPEYNEKWCPKCNAIKPITIKTPLDGVPKIRDLDSPCEDYEPTLQGYEDNFPKCETDGHYLCFLCCHNADSEVKYNRG